MKSFIKRSRIAAPAQDVFDWHRRSGAFDRLTPPWEPVRLIEEADVTVDGSRAVLEIHAGPFRLRWVAVHVHPAPYTFIDVQASGPFQIWEHTHTIEPDGPAHSILTDEIRWGLPGGRASEFLTPLVELRLERMFAWRHRVTSDEIARHLHGRRTMKVAITGASGLIGKQLQSFLTTGGHEVVRLVRDRAQASAANAAFWDPVSGEVDLAALEGVDAVVHLAGESIGEARWSATQKARILRSRTQGTATLAKALARLERKPEVLVSASAIGFYGDGGSEWLDETSPHGDRFLSDVCRQWEAAADAAREAGIRVVHPRIGVVLSPNGGALAKTLLPFKMGVGGRLGSGHQFWSWIAIDDVVAGLAHMIEEPTLEGPVNLVAPSPVTNRVFTKTLGAVLNRPTILPAPEFGLRVLLGEMADELLLTSTRVSSDKLTHNGFRFSYPELEGALRHLLGHGEVQPAAAARQKEAA